MEEAQPVGFLRAQGSGPQAELQSELCAPEPPLSVGRQGLIAIPLEPEAVEPPGAGLEEEVLWRAEGARIEVLLDRPVDLRGRRREELDDDVGHAAALLPGDPGLALARPLDAADIEDVRAAEVGAAGGDVAGLLVGVVDEHVAAGKEVLAAALGHHLMDQVDEQVHLDDVPVGLQGLPVAGHELEGKRACRAGWLAHKDLPSESSVPGTLPPAAST